MYNSSIIPEIPTLTQSNELNLKPWSWGQKISFRFLGSFFLLLTFPFPLYFIPYSYKVLFKYYYQFWEWLTIQTGKYLLLIPELKNTSTGSGDTTYDWVHIFTLLLVAALITLVWTILDQKRPSYYKLRQWLLILVSYYLIRCMFSYGITKLFYLQFIPPSMERLFQTYGHSSPMRLIWTFMGSSHTYTVFAGACEVLAGLLLIFRKTRTLGGLVTFGVMLNVFLMNMSYDIPVKIFSFQLMFMGLWVAMPDYSRLMAVFIHQTNTLRPSVHQPLFTRSRYRRLLIAIQLIIVGYMGFLMIKSDLKSRKTYGIHRPKPTLYGVYEVDKFIKNGQVVPPLFSDTTRWRRLLIDYPKSISVMGMDDRFIRYRAKTDTLKKQLTLHTRKDTVNKYTLRYERQAKDLKLSGILQKDTLEIHLKHYPMENFLLLNRGFHWVNEVPYNRYKRKR